MRLSGRVALVTVATLIIGGRLSRALTVGRDVADEPINEARACWLGWHERCRRLTGAAPGAANTSLQADHLGAKPA